MSVLAYVEVSGFEGWGRLVEMCFSCGTPIFLILLGLIVGSIIEQRHLARLELREAAVSNIPINSLPGRRVPIGPASDARIITGEVVLAADYFKSFIASLIKLVGGEMKTYRLLMERARREAIVRLREQAQREGFDEVWNIRIEAADILGSAASSSKKNKLRAMVTIVAAGTAVRRAPRDVSRDAPS
ncbi:MAG: hypothetical protein CMJ31_06235 [Phycisphaerae bacterium]|nr:hypothetical protein [Phycisphaerae bacterium]